VNPLHAMFYKQTCRSVGLKLTALSIFWLSIFLPTFAHSQTTDLPTSPIQLTNLSADKPTGLYIKIGDAKLKKSLLALPPFRFAGKTGDTLLETIRKDMQFSGLFEQMKSEAFLGDMSKVGLKPAPGEVGGFEFEPLKQAGADFLIRAGGESKDGKLSFETYIYYIPQAKLIFSKVYTAKETEASLVGHTFSNDLMRALTGQPGVFLSKIVTSRSTTPGEKEIFIMDWDGAGSRQITSHKSISTSPAWSWDGKTIAYTVFAYHPREKMRNIDLFTYDIQTGRRFLIAYKKGINSGASFTPDNKHILYTSSNSDASEIYNVGVDGRDQVKITNGRHGEINIESAVSPDGKQVAYSSDRAGKQMIYLMNVDGSNIRRITFDGDFNSTPAWSPDGTKLAFATQDTDHYDIFIMNIDGSKRLRLTSAKRPNGKPANNEEPSFSPDGRQILFRSDRTGHYQLFSISIDGENERQITSDEFEYFKPRWSPSFE
jgi:TolB protein